MDSDQLSSKVEWFLFIYLFLISYIANNIVRARLGHVGLQIGTDSLNFQPEKKSDLKHNQVLVASDRGFNRV